MQVQVFKLRENGRRLPKDHQQQPLSGELELVNYKDIGRGYTCLTLVFKHSTGMTEVTGQLLEPRLVGLKGGCMLLDGFERSKQGQTFHQCWKVLVGA